MTWQTLDPTLAAFPVHPPWLPPTVYDQRPGETSIVKTMSCVEICTRRCDDAAKLTDVMQESTRNHPPREQLSSSHLLQFTTAIPINIKSSYRSLSAQNLRCLSLLLWLPLSPDISSIATIYNTHTSSYYSQHWQTHEKERLCSKRYFLQCWLDLRREVLDTPKPKISFHHDLRHLDLALLRYAERL